MDWIHCNNCALQPGDEDERKFFTTNCGHIYCEYCLLLPELKQCRICQSTYQTMPLSSKMSKEVEIYFRNPLGDFQKFLKILEFQHSHRARFNTITRDKLKACTRLEKENSFLKEETKRLEKENLFMRDEIKRLNDHLTEYKRKMGSFRQKDLNTPIQVSSRNGYEAFRNKTPKFGRVENDAISSGNHCNIFKQPAEKQNFFVMSSKSAPHEVNLFNTPTVSKIPGSYRSVRTIASDVSSPASAKSNVREIFSQRDNVRRVKLPGDKGGPIHSTPAFRRLALSKLSSMSKKSDPPMGKYSQYFNKS